jgi:iron complex outermembrane receptor protein
MNMARLLVTSGLGLISATSAAFAQEAPGSSDGIEEVVVTAQRREENAQRAALAITALSAETLAERGISNAEDLPAVVPGLQVGGDGTGAVEVNIRGIGSTNNTEVGDPAVAFNIDGVYMARPRAASGVFYDVQRIEVLRGPQGTLYGRNATAGGVNVITNSPTHEFDGGFQIEVGDYGLFRTSGVLNAPITDQLMVRGAFQMQQRDGYTDNSPVGDYNDEQVQAGRLSVLWEPTSTFSIQLTGDAFENGGNGPRTTALGLGDLDGDLRTSPVETDGDLDQSNCVGPSVRDPHLYWRLPRRRIPTSIRGCSDRSLQHCGSSSVCEFFPTRTR